MTVNITLLMRYLVCLMAGLATVFAFEPFSWGVLVFVNLAVLCYFWQSAETKTQAFWLGLAFGYGLFGGGVSWVYVSLSTYGGMPLWMGSIAVLLFAGVLALFIGFTGYLTVFLMPRPGLSRLLVIAPLWVIFEWLKAWIFTGFPWLEIGYTQTTTWLFALAPIGGVYLISFVVVVLSGLLLCVLLSRQRLSYLFTIAVMLSLLLPLNGLKWSEDYGETVNIGIVQGNVPIELKWQAGQRDRIISQLVAQSLALYEHAEIDLFVWPETALPLYRHQTDDAFWQSIVPPQSALLTGLMDSSADDFYNAAVLSCAGQQHVYRKRHLVPFGEYLPMRFLFNWVLEYLQLPMSDFSSWEGEQPLDCPNNINLSLSICYEDAFGSEWRHYIDEATLLVNISEDAWFGDSLAPHQRLQMAQMRAREFSRPLIRSANSGPSVVIDQHGKVMAVTEQFVEQSLSYTVQPQTGKTWYLRFGNWIVWLCLGLVTLSALRKKWIGGQN